MAKIYPINSSIDTVQDVKDQFIRFDRDYYPDEVYQFILDTLEQAECTSESTELDVIAWCCELSETTLTDSDFDELDDLADHLNDRTTVICADAKTVYHLVY